MPFLSYYTVIIKMQNEQMFNISFCFVWFGKESGR